MNTPTQTLPAPSTADVTAPVKPTSQTSSVKLLVVGGLAFLVLPFLVPVVCNLLVHWNAFTLDDATSTKAFFHNYAGGVLSVIIGSGGIGTVGGSLTSRVAKYVGQLMPGIKTGATPNGEGIGVGVLEPASSTATTAPSFFEDDTDDDGAHVDGVQDDGSDE